MEGEPVSILHVSVDPGTTGAICILAPDGRVEFRDTPTIQVKNGKKTKNEFDEPGMVAIMSGVKTSAAQLGLPIMVTIEKVNAMPSIDGKRTMGTTSAFSFGMGYGMWRMCCAALGIPYRLVHPATWKKAVLAGAPKSDGAEAIIAGQLYPDIAAELRGPRGGIRDGRVDALLIAHYAARCA